MFFISYTDWMERTRSRIASRSDALKRLDKAILLAEEASEEDETVMGWFRDGGGDSMPEVSRTALAIENANRALVVTVVRKAFNNWVDDQNRKRQDWRASVRNQSGAVTELERQITYWTSRFPDPDEKAARDHLIAERNKSIPVLFSDTVVITYADAFTKTDDRLAKANAAKAAKATWQLTRPSIPGSAPSGGGSGASVIASKIDDMVRDAFGGVPVFEAAESEIRDLVAFAIHEIKDEIAALVPAAGLAAATGTFVFHTAKLVMQSIAADELLTLSHRLEGDSRAALASIRDWQLRAIAARAAKVARAGVNVGMHGAAISTMGVAVPAQLAVTLMNAILGLAAFLGEVGMQYKESRALTRYLNGRSLDRNIFAQAPLAAAYYLLNTPDSHIALQIVNIDAPGWQADVERLKADGAMKTALSEAEQLIAAMRYRIRKTKGGRLRERRAIGLATKAKDKINAAFA